MKKVRVTKDIGSYKEGDIIETRTYTCFGVFGSIPITFKQGVEAGLLECVEECSCTNSVFQCSECRQEKTLEEKFRDQRIEWIKAINLETQYPDEGEVDIAFAQISKEHYLKAIENADLDTHNYKIAHKALEDA